MIQPAKTIGGSSVSSKIGFESLLVPLLAAMFVCSGAAVATSDAPECKEAVTENPDALWQNVSKCISNEANHGDPYPCLGVDLSLGQDKGFALLKDCVGVGQVLLIPTQKITGIESPEILRDKAGHEPRNYFAEAWRARSILDALVHKDLPRNAISLAINSKCHRTQRQLHIHIDCVRPDVEKALAKQKMDTSGRSWVRNF
jgi:CDP-diacylglycerol pyrophosphatase